MNYRAAICKCVALLYKECRISKEMISSDLIRQTLDLSKPTSRTSEYAGTSVIEDIRTLVFSTLVAAKYSDVDLDGFLGDIRLACDGDESTLGVITAMIGPLDQSEEQLRKSIVAGRDALTSDIKEKELETILIASTKQLKFFRDEITDTSEWTDNVLESIKNVRVGGGKKRKGVIGLADFDNEESVANVFHEMKAFKSESRVFKFGFKGVNTMFDGGVRRGEFMVVNGLPHKYKSGMNLSLFRHVCMYNSPHQPMVEGRKPMVIRISFEDDLHMNMRHLYYDIRKSEGADPEDIAKIDDWSAEELSDFVRGNMQKTGFKVVMMRVNPNEWSFRDIFDTVAYYQSEGYEVQSLFLDYLAMIPTTGCIQGAIGQDLRNLFQRLKNFASEEMIAIVTPHQINPAAKDMLLQGKLQDSTLVQKIVGRGLYLGCRSLDNEMDAEMNIHMYEYEGKTWLAVGWAKHRNHVTRSADKLCVYELPSHGMPIPSDIHKDFASHYTIAPGPPEQTEQPRRQFY